MKCLSLSQPWATLVVLGAKRYETRSWQTQHRGPLAIHASARFAPTARGLCRQEPFRSLLARGGYSSWMALPTGVLVGTVELVHCWNVEELPQLTTTEYALGDFRLGRWAWELVQPYCLAVPIPYRGQLGVFEVPLEPALLVPDTAKAEVP
jgi:hypothetical protein